MHQFPVRLVRRVTVAASTTIVFAFAALGAAAAAYAAGEHDGHVAPTPPAPSDARFMPGTVGPVVFRGTAATVTIPDGPGFGGEVGRQQNSGDLRKNNYSVTDANYNNVLGLLPRHPDTGAPLTYVQHIQLYAAAGFIETYAPSHYGHMVMHQNRGEGTVLGAAGYLMGLVRAFDPAAHGLDPAAIPATLPGTTIDSRNYVRITRDATGQQWARPHHAQTAPAVYRMLVEAGLPASAALVVASDDGISGAGRLNGMNEQDGARDGFNSGERATWAFAAQLQTQTGVPVVLHLMHGHDHAGIDASALTRPKVNGLIGLAADDRSASAERAAAIHAALQDGRVATPATAAADQNLTVRNEAYLRPRSTLDVGFDAMWEGDQDAGMERTFDVLVENEGPHALRDVTMTVMPSTNVQVVAMAGAGVHCMVASRMCHVAGDLPSDGEDTRTIAVTVRFTAAGRGSIELRGGTTSGTETTKLVDRRSVTVRQKTTASVGVAAARVGTRVRACGTNVRRSCVVARRLGTQLVVGARPGAYPGVDRRAVEVVFQQRVGRTWRARGSQWIRPGASGLARVRVTPSRLRMRGAWRVQVRAKEHHLLRAGTSGWRYLAVR